MSSHLCEIEFAIGSFDKDAQRDQCLHQAEQGVLVRICQTRQLSDGLWTFRENVGDAELGGNVDDGCRAMPGEQVYQRVRRWSGTLGRHCRPPRCSAILTEYRTRRQRPGLRWFR